MKKLFISFLFIVFSLPLCARKVALTIGNDNYISIPKLQKARSDAELIGQNLKKVGYEVQIIKDANYKDMVRSIDKFLSSVKGDDEVVFFYAGHGVQLKTGNYFLPIDLEPHSEAEIERMAYPLDELMDRLNETKARFKLIVIDACRDNPLAVKGRSIGGTRGLSPPEPPKGQMIIYSASRGQQALDSLSASDPNNNGVFTRVFAKAMSTSGDPIEKIAKNVQDEVERLAKSINHEQRPAIYNESRGDFYFINNPCSNTALQSNKSKILEDSETKLWNEVTKIGTIEAYKAYLVQYPNGIFKQLALLHSSININKQKNNLATNELENSVNSSLHALKVTDISGLSNFIQKIKSEKPNKPIIEKVIGTPKLVSLNQDGYEVGIWELIYANAPGKGDSRAMLAITFGSTGRTTDVSYRIVNN